MSPDFKNFLVVIKHVILYIFVPSVGVIFWIYQDTISVRAKSFDVEKGQFINVVKYTLSHCDAMAVCLDNLRIAHESVFAKAGNGNLNPPPNLSSLLAALYVAAMSNEAANTDPDAKDFIAKLLAVIRLLKSEEPYADLPFSDRELLDSISNKLQSIHPDIAKPLVSHLSAVLIEKNDETRKYRNETSRANQVALISLIVALVALIQPLVGLIKWVKAQFSKSNQNSTSPQGSEA